MVSGINQQTLKSMTVVQEINNKPNNYKNKPIWINIIFLAFVHIFGPHGLYLAIAAAQWKTNLYAIVLYYCSILGVTAGAHRLWSHRSYKANLPLQILLCLFQTMAGQYHIYAWARYHRVHHKHTDTDADPHNSTRGLLFSHVFWMLFVPHPDVVKNLKDIDVADLRNNPVVMFQKKYFWIIMPPTAITLPALIPWYFWGEDFYVAWAVSCMAKYFVTTNASFTINSLAHAWGGRPYDKDIKATQNKFVSWVAAGEGWHNYHHVFPQDYKASEFGSYSFNFSAAFIDLMAKIGWAYDLKTVSPKMIDQRASRTGDGTKRTEY